MARNEMISVIVPVYNVEQYLEKCIDSILAQTYQNIEVLLIDDGSPDSCGEICDWYANRDVRVRAQHKENEGLAEARNEGVRLASGKYIVFVDSDDYIEPDMLKVLYQRMQQDNSDLAICNFLYVDENGVPQAERNKDLPIKDEVISGAEAFGRLADEKYWYYVTAVNKLYKKEILEGLPFPKGKLHEDEFIAHYVLGKCQSVSCVKKPLYMYVQREKSIMNQTFSVRRLDGIEAFCARVEYACEMKNRRVAEDSLNMAGNLLLEGYRRLRAENEYRSVLKAKRKRYNKTYTRAFFTKLCRKVRVKGALILIHPCIYLKMSEWFRKGK